jgi:hypothetical protein
VLGCADNRGYGISKGVIADLNSRPPELIDRRSGIGQLYAFASWHDETFAGR